MFDFVSKVFSSDFMGHGYCYLWKPEIVWLHVGSDALITLAYYSIPFALLYFVRKRRDLPFNWMFLMFGAFILGCGTTHAMEVWTVWHGTYRLAGIIKLITAGLSVGTAVALVPLIPKALSLPSPAQLSEALAEREQEVQSRRAAEENARRLNEDLERRVAERTVQLEAMNENLRREMADRKRAEERFRLAVEAAPNAMVMADQDGTIVLVNSQTEAWFGYGRNELVGQSINVLRPARFRDPEQGSPIFARPDARPLGAGQDRFGLRKDGTEFPIEVGLNRIETDQGNYVLIAIVDISDRRKSEEERRRLEAQVQHVQKLESLGVLAGGIAHDFNNLLVGILGNAGLALMEMLPESPARPTVQKIEVAALRAAELTKQMLAYSGKGMFKTQPLNLSRVVSEMLHLLSVSISKKATIRTRLTDELPAIEGDAAQIQQVVMNLITNASEALGDNAGEIVIATGTVDADRAYLADTFLDENLPEGRYVFLEVSDTGAGMDKITIARIFDPFFTTKFTGRGLGLAAVLGIIRGHHGGIRVYSEPGRGTAFKILLPATDLQIQASTPRADNTAWRSTGTVLVIDDEPAVLAVAGNVLERVGFKALTANKGRAGVDLFREHAAEIRAVLLDLTMPDLSGEEVFRAIRMIRADVKVILSSGYNEQETISLFRGKGLAGFLQKPYQPSQLVDTMRELLG